MVGPLIAPYGIARVHQRCLPTRAPQAACRFWTSSKPSACGDALYDDVSCLGFGARDAAAQAEILRQQVEQLDEQVTRLARGGLFPVYPAGHRLH